MTDRNIDYPDFEIKVAGPLSETMRRAGLYSFGAAMEWVRRLPYGRNIRKEDPLVLFSEGSGTCSTKHALLRRLAVEQKQDDIRLYIGIFQMNASNTPPVAATLQAHNLPYIPEAHCYLKYHDLIIDCTRRHSVPGDFVPYLLMETEIEAEQAAAFKVSYHKAFFGEWLPLHQPGMSLDQLWSIRERCIKDLSV